MNEPGELPVMRLDRSLARLRNTFLEVAGNPSASTQGAREATRPPTAPHAPHKMDADGNTPHPHLLGRAFAIVRQWLPWQR